MDLANDVGRGEVELIEAAVDEDAARVEHGTHGAVGDNDAGRQLVAEFLSAGTDGCSHVETVASAVGNGESAICFILPQVGRGALGLFPGNLQGSLLQLDRKSLRAVARPCPRGVAAV